MAKVNTTKTANCQGCRALLTNAHSVARGYGDRCWAKKRREDAVRIAGYKSHQLASATELIEDGAILPIRPGTYIGVSTDGADRYICTVDTCTCAAYEAGRKCYHRAAALMLLAA
ncbi:DUF6011 domain-containing protein [Actinomadura sp. LOL_016]|uniref:DUF6011 domain-containing protein n=1 Tax=unclassified Actinomadura TaxID=2626254 RepID=UPI003A8029D4